MSNDDTQSPKLLTVVQTAQYLGISEAQLRSIIRHDQAGFPVIQVSPRRMMISLIQVKHWLTAHGMAMPERKSGDVIPIFKTPQGGGNHVV